MHPDLPLQAEDYFGVASGWSSVQPFQKVAELWGFTLGSSWLATQGWKVQSRWDWEAGHLGRNSLAFPNCQSTGNIKEAWLAGARNFFCAIKCG